MIKVVVWEFNVQLTIQESQKRKLVNHVQKVNQSILLIQQNVLEQIMLDFVHLINHFMIQIYINVQYVQMEQLSIQILINVKVKISSTLQIFHQIFAPWRHPFIMKTQELVNNVLNKNNFSMWWLKLAKIVLKIIQLTILKQKNVRIVHNKSLFITQHKESVNNVQNHHHFIVITLKSVKNAHRKNLTSTQPHSLALLVHPLQLFIILSQILATNAP